MPIILEKIPNTIKLQISRKLEKKINIEKILSAINLEITTRENFTVLVAKKKIQLLLPVHYMPKQD